MKKALVLLLILAVAGGIFAQEAGEFSWSGGVEINGVLDLAHPNGEIKDDGSVKKREPLIKAKDDANTKGNVDLAYTKGGLTLGTGFSATYMDADDGKVNKANIGLSANYVADNWGAHSELDLFNRTPNDVGTILNEGPNSLWGYYTFMDNALRFDVSYKGGGNGIWAVSDIVLDEFSIDPIDLTDWGAPTGKIALYEGWNKFDDGHDSAFQFTFTGV